MASPLHPNPSGAMLATENVVIESFQIGLPNIGDPGNGRCPQELRAVPWPDGKRIDLVWINPKDNNPVDPVKITRVIIKRSKVAHSAFLTDDAEVIFDGPPIEHFIDGVKLAETIGAPDLLQTPPTLEIGVPSTGVDLEEKVYYYYTVYMTVAPQPSLLDFGLEAQSPCQVTGLSIPRYREQRGRFGGEWFYRMMTGATRQADQEDRAAKGLATGWFQNYCRFIQGGLDVLIGHNEALEKYLGDADKAPAGLVGLAVHQSSILNNWCRRFGINPERHILDVSIMRRIAQSMIALYKTKGSCPSIVDFTKVLTLWDSTCTEFGDSQLTCNPFYLKTWDGVSSKNTFSFPSSVVTSSPGLVQVPGIGLDEDLYAGGLIVGPMWDQFPVISNTQDTITLDPDLAGTSVVRFEDLLTIDTVTPVSGTLYDLEVTRTAGGPALLNDAEYDSMQMLDSANTSMAVVSTTSDTGGGVSSVRVDSGVLPIVGASAVSRSYIVGASFATRDPIFIFDLYTGCLTFLYDPLKDLSLQGAAFDPHDVLFSGGSLLGIPFIDGDVILRIQPGVAVHRGFVEAVAGNQLTDSSANFGAPGTLSFFRLNPNHNQAHAFQVVANSSTTITVSSPDNTPSVTLEDVAAVDTEYYVLSFPDWRKYEVLVRLIRRMLPVGIRIFIFFD